MVVRVFHIWEGVVVRAIVTAPSPIANPLVFSQLSLGLLESTSPHAKTVWQADCDLAGVFASDISDINGGSLFRGRRGVSW